MPWYTLDEALNCPQVPRKWIDEIVIGEAELSKFILDSCMKFARTRGKPCMLALDGYLGVDWKKILSNLKQKGASLGIKVVFIDISSCYRAEVEIEKMVEHCLNRDPYFGYIYKGKLSDFFNPERTNSLRAELEAAKGKPRLTAVICYGVGATISTLSSQCDIVAYFDVTRQTIVGQLEKKQVMPLGCKGGGLSARKPFKRFSYVDQIILNKHKKRVLTQIDWYVDANNASCPKLLPRAIYDGILAAVSKYPFRLKPVYIPGVWGGQYLKQLRKLPSEMVNCAFCLEIIPQTQAIRIAIGRDELEMPFYNLLWNQPIGILGRKSFEKFGYYFPITANYDDTSQGGNLAIQVHPNGKYLREQFNERMRRDESYYLVKAWDGAKTYHGLKNDADLEELRRLSIEAEKEGIPFDHDKYVNSWPSDPGDLFLIPAGTVHASGANQLVLEIDSDPSWGRQEYTFHIYDYLRKDLDGSLRAIHIDHSFAVIRPYRRRSWVGKHLKQKPRLLRKGTGWAEYRLSDNQAMYYRTQRLEFEKEIKCATEGKFHLLVLVEGESVLVYSAKYPERQYTIKFTEGLIIPACVGKYVVINKGKNSCKVTKSFIK